MPGFVPPQLASLRSMPPAGDNWLHEIKYDGYRLQIHLDKGRVTIRTRTGLDWTKRFSAIAAAFDIPVDRAIFDGEVVAVKDGRTNFSELQAALAAGRQEALTFNAFDLLFLEGFDLRDAPLIERKRILKELLDETGVSGPILYADHLVSDGPLLFAHACKLGFEGIISKKADAPYRSERSDAWIKVKCVQRAKFPVVVAFRQHRIVVLVVEPHGSGDVAEAKLRCGWVGFCHDTLLPAVGSCAGNRITSHLQPI